METAAIPAPDSPLPPSPRPERTRSRMWLRPVWPAFAATLLLLAMALYVVWAIKSREGGHFVYTVDDGYFHMAVAKNVIRHGIWGISALDGFSSGTSSLLWPLVIAASFALFGFHEYFPFVLNLLAAAGLVFYVGWIMRRTTGLGFLGLVVLVAVVVLTPIVAVASTGMEHCLQMLLNVMFVDVAARLLTTDAQRLATIPARVWLCLAAALQVMTRYEGLFLVAPVGLFLLCQRRWLLAVALGVAAAAPVVVFGLIAVSKGWYFLPNSLLIKGSSHLSLNPVTLYYFLQKWYIVMFGDLHLIALVTLLAATTAAAIQRGRTLWTYPALFLSITLVATLQHLQFAGIGWFYRYEAYLIVLAMVGVGVAVGYARPEFAPGYWRTARSIPHWTALGFAALLFGSPFWARANFSFNHSVTASYNIFEQQYQMGHFVRRYYDGKCIAANDVGAISYFGEIRILDLVGLADVEVLRARRANFFANYDHATLRKLCDRRHVDLVLVYDAWSELYGGPLPEWILVGQWTIPHNTVVGSDTVSFYAPRLEQVPALVRHLREFGATMPRDIRQTGIYRGEQPLQATGTFGLEGDPDAGFYWSPDEARFTIFPPPDTPLDSDETTLRLSLLPVSEGMTADVFFDDQLVLEKQEIPAGSPVGWVSFPVKARWRAGANTVRVVVHGKPVRPPHDPRSLLFRILDPRKMMDDEGKVTPQLLIPTAR